MATPPDQFLPSLSQQVADMPEVPAAFDWEKFRASAHLAVDFIIDVQKKTMNRQLPVRSTVEPGYLQKQLPLNAPDQPCSWEEVMDDMKKKVLPGMTLWQHPDFHAFFPCMLSPPALLGDLISNVFNQPGFNWVASPAATEMEMLVMDWLCRAFELPSSMLWEGTGGGVCQPTATEALVVTMLAARNRALNHCSTDDERIEKAGKLVCYFTDQSHFCVEKAAKILNIPYTRKLPSRCVPEDDNNMPVDTAILKKTLEEDHAKGLIPFYVSVSFGATGVCAIDPLDEVVEIVNDFNQRHAVDVEKATPASPSYSANQIWLNLDAAYAGSVAICPEFRSMLKGCEHFDSVLINGSKWFSTMFNCSFMFFTSKRFIVQSLNTTGVYLQNEASDTHQVVDFKDYQLGLGRPFRSLKVYCTLKQFGLEGMRATLRRHTVLAQYLKQQILAGNLHCNNEAAELEIVRTQFGLVCFRLKNTTKETDKRNMDYLALLNNADKYGLFLVHTESGGRVVLRLVICDPRADKEAMDVLAAKLHKASTEFVMTADAAQAM